MSRERLEQALSNWQAKRAEYEYELSVTSSTEKQFELRIKIEECLKQIKRLQDISKNPDRHFDEQGARVSKQSEKLKSNPMTPTPSSPDPKLNILPILLGILSLLGVGVFTITISNNTDKLDSSLTPISKLIKVNLAVKDLETKQAIQDVKVYFLSQGAPTTKFTDENGYTSMEIPERGDIQITLTKSGYKTRNFTINLQNDKNRTGPEYMEKDSFQKGNGQMSPPSLPPNQSSSSPTKANGVTNTTVPKNPTSNPEKIGELEGLKLFEHTISANYPKQSYHFKLANSSDISLYIDKVSSEVKLSLYKANSAGVITGSNINSAPAHNASPGVIQQNLNTGDYVVVVDFKNRGTSYLLRFFNNTMLAENVDFLETSKQYVDQTISSELPQKYYHFKLANPSNISLRLDGVNSEIKMLLYKANKAGVITGSNINSAPASNASPGVIQQNLNTGDYVVVVHFQTRETKYNLAMSAQ